MRQKNWVDQILGGKPNFLRVFTLSAAVLGLSTLQGYGFDAQLKLSSDEDITASLEAASLVFAAKREESTTPQEVLAAARADYRRLTAALYGLGYYSGVIHISIDGSEAAEVSPLHVPARIKRVTLSIDPGNRFVFGNTQIAPLAPGTVLPEAFNSGKVALSGAVAQAAGAAVAGWRDHGHAKATVSDQKVTADHRASTLAANITMQPGPQVKFGEFKLTGNRTVRDARTNEIAGFPTGTVFSPEELETVRNRLLRTGAYRSVSLVEATDLRQGNLLDVTANLVKPKPYRFGFGGEISSLDGAEISGFWLARNLWGGGERFRVGGEITGIGGVSDPNFSIAARLDRPATFGPDKSAFVLGELDRLDEDNYLSTQGQITAGVTAEYSKYLTLEASGGYRFSNVSDSFGDRKFHHLVLPVSAVYDRRDSELVPTRGYYLGADALPFIGVRDSESGTQIEGDLRGYLSLDKANRVVLASRVQIGGILQSSLEDTPPDLLFYSGGGGSVRGQPYQSLDVDLGGGDRAGGRTLFSLSTEVRADVGKNIGLVGFFDAGFVGPDSFSVENGAWHSGAGIGLRYATGIGPIRLDLATPVSGTTGDGIQVYVGIGQSF